MATTQEQKQIMRAMFAENALVMALLADADHAAQLEAEAARLKQELTDLRARWDSMRECRHVHEADIQALSASRDREQALHAALAEKEANEGKAAEEAVKAAEAIERLTAQLHEEGTVAIGLCHALIMALGEEVTEPTEKAIMEETRKHAREAIAALAPSAK